MKNKILTAAVLLIISAVSLFAQLKEDALVLYNQGNYNEAVKICRGELETAPKNMDSYSVLTWSLLKLGKYETALEEARKALKISRYDARIVEVLGEAYYHLGKNIEALKWFEEYTVLAPSGPRIDLVYYYMGEIFILLSEYNHADTSFTTAVHYSPNIARWWSRLGYAREMAKDYTYAIEAYKKALSLKPSLSDAKRGLERSEKSLRSGG